MKTIIDKKTGKVLFAATDSYEVLSNEMAVNEIVVNGPFVEKFFSHLPCVILSISPLDSLVEEQSQNSFLKFIENVEDMYIPLERVVHFL